MTYRIVPDKKVILGFASGQMKWKDIILAKAEVGADPLFDPSYNMLDDIREAHIILSDKKEIQEFFEFAKSKTRYIGNRNTAMLTNTPNQVANSELLKMMGTNSPMNFNTFSTLERAMNWVGLTAEDSSWVEECLGELKNQPENNFK